MINKILLIFGLLVSSLMNSQIGNYAYTTRLNVRDGGNHVVDCENSFSLQLCGNNGCRGVTSDNLDNINGTPQYNNTTIISSNFNISYYKTHSERHWKNAFGCTGGDGDRTGGYWWSCSGTYFDNVMTEWYSNLFINRRPIYTILDPNPVNNYITPEDNITINSHEGFLPSEYNWEYSFTPLDPITWTELQQFRTASSISVNAKDFLGGIDNPAFYGRTVYIRQFGCDHLSPSIIKYVIVKNPPKFVNSSPIITDNDCFYGNSGSATFQFDSNLEMNEYFSFNLNKKIKDANNQWVLGPVTGIQVLPVNFINKTYTFSGLEPGTYDVTNQTTFQTNTFITTSQQYTSNQFTIKAPPALVYTARMAQPKCAGGSAEIVINTKGGRPPYYYCINCPNDDARIQYTSDTGVPNPDHGLPNGDYIITIPGSITGSNISIKVTDSKNCVDPATIAPQ